MTLADPPRLTDDPAASASLREALRDAREVSLDDAAAVRVRADVERATSAPRGLTLVKGLGALVVVAALVGLGAGVLDSDRKDDAIVATEPEPEPEPEPESEPEPDPDPESDPEPEPEPEPVPDPEPEPEPKSEPQPRSPPPPHEASKSEPAVDAVAEAKLLLAARRALAGDPARALALTDDHAARYPDGALAEERELIAIRALMATGKVDAAQSRGERFVDRYPASGHRPAVESALRRE